MGQDNERSSGVEGRHSPKQSRGVETRNSILEAGTTLFEEQGYEQTTTHQIASRAGVSVGALYRYFSDKEAILKEIYRNEVSGLRNRILREISLTDIMSGEVREMLNKALSLAFDIYSERPSLRRVLSEQSRKIPELSEQRRAQETEVHMAVQQIFASVEGVGLPDIEVGAYLVSLFMESLIDDYTLYRRDHNRFSRERVIASATDFILSYVLRQQR